MLTLIRPCMGPFKSSGFFQSSVFSVVGAFSFVSRLARGETAPGAILRPDPHGGLFFEEVRPDQCDRTEHPGQANRVSDRPRPFWPGCACHVALIGPHLLENHWPKRGQRR